MTMFRENLYTGDALERNWKHSPAVMEYCTSRWVLYCTVLYCTAPPGGSCHYYASLGNIDT